MKNEKKEYCKLTNNNYLQQNLKIHLKKKKREKKTQCLHDMSWASALAGLSYKKLVRTDQPIAKRRAASCDASSGPFSLGTPHWYIKRWGDKNGQGAGSRPCPGLKTC